MFVAAHRKWTKMLLLGGVGRVHIPNLKSPVMGTDYKACCWGGNESLHLGQNGISSQYLLHFFKMRVR